MKKSQWFVRGMRAGIPISLGYFAVAIALGIAAKKAGITAFQASLTSLLINASAGEYAGFKLISQNAIYPVIILMEAIANARYLLMSTALSQRLEQRTTIWERLLLGFTVTDEIFGVSIALDGAVSPYFVFGTFVVSTFGWTAGTLTGAILGSVLPLAVVSALNVGLFGMFVSIFVPAAKKNKVVAATVIIGFALSLACAKLPYISAVPEGIRVIIITVVISLAAAILFPIKEEKADER